jgi:hypothetical protein
MKITGPLEFYVVTPVIVPDLMAKANAGDVAARLSMDGVSTFLKMQAGAKRGQGRKCLMCEYEFSNRANRPAAFVSMVPMFPSTEPKDDEELALISPVCRDCFDKPVDFEQALCDRLRELWNGADIRKILAH